jgi:hypothetical protein
VFGENNRLSVLTLIERVGGWVREDIRDPERLFLMGVVLHADGDARASEFFEAAYRLGGSGDHLLAFLHPNSGPEAAPANPSGPVWNGPARNGPAYPRGTPYEPEMPNGGSPAPLPHEPQDVLPPQMAAPPDFGPAEPNGMFSPPGQMPPRGLYQPLPPGTRPPTPWSDRPADPTSSPLTIQPAMPSQPGMPSQAVPVPQRTPRQTAPPKGMSPPPKANPATPVLPLPPLPAPEEPSAERQDGAQSGPALDGPALAAPSPSGSTTVQSP